MPDKTKTTRFLKAPATGNSKPGAREKSTRPRRDGAGRASNGTRVLTGVAGLDEVLHGGLIPNQSYMVCGGPGTGKTILALHFLSQGAKERQRSLYITLDERADDIRRNAEQLGFDLDGIDFLDLSPAADSFGQSEPYEVFSPAEVEGGATSQRIVDAVKRLKPARVVVDVMTQFRYLTPDAFQFRRQALAFLRFLSEQHATVMFTSEGSVSAPDDDMRFMADGVLLLESVAEGRYVSIAKFRGSSFEGGRHSVRISERGMTVFPRLVPSSHTREFKADPLSFGVPELDRLCKGGLERGTVTIISGPAGVGKTTLGLQLMKEAATRGERSAGYLFEERIETALLRAENVGIPARKMIERGSLSLCYVEPLLYSTDQFAQMVREEVEGRRARLIMIDSLAGYRLSLRGEDLAAQLQALCGFCRNMGATLIIIDEIRYVTGLITATDSGLSHMGDNILVLRYMEIEGQLRRSIGVLKKRLSGFETNLREFEITAKGFRVGKSLKELRGMLTGAPTWAAAAPDIDGQER